MKYVPNLLTVLRILLVPWIWKLLWDRQYEWVIGVGFVASMSDAVDGWIARKFEATSKIGALLDPVADKLMLSGAYLIFGLHLVVPMSLTFLVLARDIFILLFAAWAGMFTKIRDFPPSRWGKLSTLIQILTALTILVSNSVLSGNAIAHGVEQLMIWLCAAATAWSAIHYARQAVDRLRS
jgi:cardiolipin synthase